MAESLSTPTSWNSTASARGLTARSPVAGRERRSRARIRSASTRKFDPRGISQFFIDRRRQPNEHLNRRSGRPSTDRLRTDLPERRDQALLRHLTRLHPSPCVLTWCIGLYAMVSMSITVIGPQRRILLGEDCFVARIIFRFLSREKWYLRVLREGQVEATRRTEKSLRQDEPPRIDRGRLPNRPVPFPSTSTMIRNRPAQGRTSQRR